MRQQSLAHLQLLSISWHHHTVCNCYSECWESLSGVCSSSTLKCSVTDLKKGCEWLRERASDTSEPKFQRCICRYNCEWCTLYLEHGHWKITLQSTVIEETYCSRSAKMDVRLMSGDCSSAFDEFDHTSCLSTRGRHTFSFVIAVRLIHVSFSV